MAKPSAVEFKYVVTASTEEAVAPEAQYHALARSPLDAGALEMIWEMALENALQDESRLRERVLAALKRTEGAALNVRKQCIGAALEHREARVGVVVVASKAPCDPFGCLLAGGGAFLNAVRGSSGARIWLEPRSQNDRCVANIASARLLLVTADSAGQVMDALREIVPKLAEEACAIAGRPAPSPVAAAPVQVVPAFGGYSPPAPPAFTFGQAVPPAPASPPGSPGSTTVVCSPVRSATAPAPAACTPPPSQTQTPPSKKRPAPSPISPEQRARAAANKEAALRKLAEKRARRESAVASAYER
jgi:hypothetical protein